MKNKANGTFVRLLLLYAALESFRHSGWMVFYEQFVDVPRQFINMGFILYSGTIALTALLAPRLLRYGERLGGMWKGQPVFSAAVCAAAVLRAVQWFAPLPVAAVLLVMWTVSIMVGICMCYALVFRQLPRNQLGRFFGIAYCLDSLLVSFIERFTGTPAYPFVCHAVGLVLCVGAVWVFRVQGRHGEPPLDEPLGGKPARRLAGFGLASACLYVLMAGTMDNLYFFDDWLALPYVGLFTLPMMGIMYLAGGFLYDRLRWRITVPAAVACICLAQSMPFFAPQGIFAYAYSVFSGLGTTFLQLVVVMLPILYERGSLTGSLAQGAGVPAGGAPPAQPSLNDGAHPDQTSLNGGARAPLGEGLFYAGFCLSSIAFLFVSQKAFRPVMGATLLAGVACLMLLIEVIVLHERQTHRDALERQRLAMEALRQNVAVAGFAAGVAGPDRLLLYEESTHISFTRREKELMPHIASTLTAEEIAALTHVSVSTIRFHIRNILGKTGARNRRELTRLFWEPGQVDVTDQPV